MFHRRGSGLFDISYRLRSWRSVSNKLSEDLMMHAAA
jgi:hypothetical protein